MPIFEVTSPDGRVIEVTAPEGATESQAIAYAQANWARLTQEAPLPAPVKRAPFSIEDTARAFGQGVVGGVKSLTDVFGAGNVASNILEAAAKDLGAGMSEARLAELRQQAERTKAAEASGDVKQEALAAWQGVKEAPVQAAAQAAGSIVPTLVGGAAGKALKWTAASIKALQGVIGAGMGAGAVKGSIYDAVYEQNIEDGASPQVAHQQAQAAQAYTGKNLEQIGLGAGLGAIASSTGVEKLLLPGAAKAAPAGLRRRVASTLASEMPLEATQGGQERLAANLALQRAGYDVPTFRGVAGQATQEGLMAGLAAGPIAAVRGPSPELPPPPAAPEVAPPPPEAPAPTLPATYESLTLEREALRQEPKTAETKARLKELDEQIKQMTLQQAIEALQMGELKGRRVPSDTGAGPAAEAAEAFLTPEQMEMRAATVEQPATPELDLFGNPIAPTAPTVPEAAPATGEELEAAGQQRLDLPEMMSPPITPKEVEQFGAVMSKTNRAWMVQNVQGKSPEQVRAEFGGKLDSIPKGVVKAVKEVIQSALPLEAANAPITTQPAVKPTTKRGGAGPSVAAPVEPAGGQGAGPAPSAGTPAKPESGGLADTGAAAVAGARPAEPVGGALEAVPAAPLPEINAKLAENETRIEGILEAQNGLRLRNGNPPVPNTPAGNRWADLQYQLDMLRGESTELSQQAEAARQQQPEAAAAETAEVQAERDQIAAGLAAVEAERAKGVTVPRVKAAEPAAAPAAPEPEAEPIAQEDLAIKRVGNALAEGAVTWPEHDFLAAQTQSGDMPGALKTMHKLTRSSGVRYQAATQDADQVPLTEEAVDALRSNDLVGALNSIGNTSASQLNKAVARRLQRLLKDTVVNANEELKNPKGEDAYGATSKNGMTVWLHKNLGLNEETVLHESVHAATERVLSQDEATLTEQQRMAKRELTSLWEAAKKDPNIKLTEDARASLSEFATEALTNPILEKQLKAKPWKSKNAWHWFKKHILQMLGITDPATMHDYAIASMDTIFSKPERAAPQVARQTDTPAFKKWFGNSKVVDKNGDPLVVYHGTTADFSTFDAGAEAASGRMEGDGFYFAADPDLAAQYAGEESGANVMPVYLAISNPFTGELSNKDLAMLMKWPRFAAVYNKEVSDVNMPGYVPSIERLGVLDGRRNEFITEALERAGYDGRIIDGEYPSDTVYVAFRPEQIKSATGNIGTFDPTNPDIRYQLTQQTQTGSARQRAIVQAAIDKGANTVLGTARGGMINDAITMLRTKITDDAATVSGRLAVKFNNAMRDATGKLNPIVRVRQAKDAPKMLGAYIQQGALDQTKDGTWLVTTKNGIPPFKECIDLIEEWGKSHGLSFERAHEEAHYLLMANRLYNLRKTNPDIKRHLTDAEIDVAMVDYRADPRLAKMNEIMDKGRNALVDHMVRVGRLTREQGKAYKDVVGYVPFDREQLNDDMLQRVQKKVGRGIAQAGTLPEIIGSETRPVKNVFDNYISTVSWMMKEIMHQDASLATLREMESMGLAKFHKGSVKPHGTNNTVHTFIDGEDWTVEVPSAYDVMAFNVRRAPLNPLLKAMSNVTSVLRTSVTAFPLFSAKQVAEDTQRAIMHSGVKNIPLLTKLIAQNYYTLAKAAAAGKHSNIIDEMANIGLNGGSDYSYTDPAGMVMRQLGREKFKLLGSTKAGALLHRLENIAHASDLAVRKAIYDVSLLETGDKALAQSRAREIINFRTRGASEAIDIFLSTVPFFNAYLQGLDVTYRSMTGKDAVSGLAAQQARKMFLQKAGIAFSMAVMYALLRTEEGDDEYLKTDKRERDNSWIMGGGIAIPVPTELGALIKVPAERMVEYYRRYGTPNEQSALEAIRTWLTYAGDQTILRTNLVPLSVRPAVEILTNHSFVTGRELIGARQANVDPSEQVQPRTSEFAKSVAKFVADSTGVQVSPIHIDTVFNGYLGTSWAATSMALDAMINPSRTDRPIDRFVGLSAFTYSPIGTEPINEFYELANKTNRAAATLNQLVQTDPARAEAYVREHAAELEVDKMVNHTLREISKLRQYTTYLNSEPGAQAVPDSAERLRLLEEAKKYEVELVGWVQQVKAAYKL